MELKSRVDRFAFQCQNAEDTFMYATERFLPNEALQSFDAQGKLAEGQGPFLAQPAIAQPAEILVGRIIRSVDDAQVLAATALYRGLGKAPLAPVDETGRLDHHALAAALGQLDPPVNSRGFARWIG